MGESPSGYNPIQKNNPQSLAIVNYSQYDLSRLLLR